MYCIEMMFFAIPYLKFSIKCKNLEECSSFINWGDAYVVLLNTEKSLTDKIPTEKKPYNFLTLVKPPTPFFKTVEKKPDIRF